MGTHLPSFKHQMCCRGEGERFLLMKLNGELFHDAGESWSFFPSPYINLHAASDFMAVSKMLTVKIESWHCNCTSVDM